MNRLTLASLCALLSLCTPPGAKAEFLDIDFSAYAPAREQQLDPTDFINAYSSPDGFIEGVAACDYIWSGAADLSCKGVYFRPTQEDPAVLTLNLNPEKSVKSTAVRFRIWAYNAMNTSTDAVTLIQAAINGKEYPVTEVNGLSSKGKPVLANIGFDTPDHELCRTISLSLLPPEKEYADFQMCLERIYVVYDPDDNGGAAVESVSMSTDDAPPAVYDLHGRIISGSALAPGIYIVRSGSAASKITVR